MSSYELFNYWITVLPWIVARRLLISRAILRKYFVNFWKYKYFENQILSSRSVIEMIHHFDMKRYPRERGKKMYTLLWGLLFKEILYSIFSTVDCPWCLITCFNNLELETSELEWSWPTFKLFKFGSMLLAPFS